VQHRRKVVAAESIGLRHVRFSAGTRPLERSAERPL